MKNSKIYKIMGIGAALAFGLSSCNDFLTIGPEDQLVQDTYYSSAEMLRNNTMVLYASKAWSNFHMNFQWKLDMINGDMFYTYDAEGQWFFGSYTPLNTYINEGWKGLYNVIAFANSVINDMPGNCTGTVTQDDIDKAIAEARCVRGFCYYMIAEIWHDAPIVYNNTENITNNDIDLPRNTQKSIYQFALEDLNYAEEYLPETDTDSYRCTKQTARAFRAKLLLTMASHSDYGYDRASLYQQAADDAMAVMDANNWLTDNNFSTLFDVESNNGPESIFAIQCAVQGYSYGNARNVAWSRSSVIADQTWGAGKGPTIALQKLYDPTDKRRMWTYMTNGDYYPNLAKADGGYTYYYINRADDGTVIEDRNEMNAHIKKYIIGKSADCNGNVGLNQDAANNIYLMRLADMYLTYAEAVMGTANSTSDPTAIQRYNAVRDRAGLTQVSSITYEDLMKERLREFAFESQSWFDTQRLRYREGDQMALNWINTGYGTGYNRASQYNQIYGTDQADENKESSYQIVQSKAEYAQYDPIILTADAFVCPIPAAVSTSSPKLSEDPVDFYSE
ncbi:MAG: RagB/SusD family nutrient uptake outer membrane protein [Bacteroidales bacterium]|nr:RagB/SusD family nutrient uptake outer membrane protein [Bacteroidales bacterium]